MNNSIPGFENVQSPKQSIAVLALRIGPSEFVKVVKNAASLLPDDKLKPPQATQCPLPQPTFGFTQRTRQMPCPCGTKII